MGILDINPDDISALSRGDLQALVARLCEAELKKCELPPTGVQCTENTDASDKSIDVSVDAEARIGECGFIPKGKTAFQVKQTEVPKSKIRREMLENKGKGKLRKAIADIFEKGGAYVIVSGKDFVPPSGINDREEEMRSIAPPGATVCFYGKDKIAQWARCHSSVDLWLRKKVQKPIGWEPFGDWSNPGLPGEGYLFDNGIFLLDRQQGKKKPVVDGINKIRQKLRERNSPVRIIGLSGMGKTRLVQALFDPKLGEAPLEKDEAVYADSAKKPSPLPIQFARELVAGGHSVVLIVDNCDGELHRNLAEECGKSDKVKLVTVELDIREDIRDDADVFELRSESPDVVEKLLMRRYRGVGEINIKNIAQFCGGNLRMGIVIAKSVLESGGSPGNLRNKDFLDRLFWQKQKPDKELKKTAEACSLIYSFGVDGESGELKALASLVGRDVKDAYRDVAEFVRRGIAQERGDMRAILPEAFANQFAADALENIHPDEILKVVMQPGNERLLKSFSRRLGYLHTSKKARAIAEQWLSPGGLLDIKNRQPDESYTFRDLRETMLKNIAPTSPQATLDFIKRAVDGGVVSSDFPRILFYLAYDSEMFEDAAELLKRFAMLTPQNTNSESLGILCTLCRLPLSGTHAPLHKRLAFVKNLTNSENEEEWKLGLQLLASSLRTRGFTARDFSFGAHARDFGYYPKSRADYHKWVAAFIRHAGALAMSQLPAAPEAKKVLADNFRALWNIGMGSELEVIARDVARRDNWHEMAHAVLQTIRFDGDRMTAEYKQRLIAVRDLFALEEQCLRDKFKLSFGYGASGALRFSDLKGQKVPPEKMRDYVLDMGARIVRSEPDFKALLPDMLCASRGGDKFSLGCGIADGSCKYRRVWGDLREQFSRMTEDKRDNNVLAGFISAVAKKDAVVAREFLEQSVTDSALAHSYPRFEACAGMAEGAATRLLLSLNSGIAPTRMYQYLTARHGMLNDVELTKIIRVIARRPDGAEIAAEILSYRLDDIQEGDKPDPLIVQCCRDVLECIIFSSAGAGEFYSYGKLITISLNGDGADVANKKLCRKLAHELTHRNIYNASDVLRPLAQKQPVMFLNEFLIFDEDYYLNSDEICDAIAEIDDDIVVRWCEKNPDKYYIAALVVEPCQTAEGGGKEFTSIARHLIDKAPDKARVLGNLQLRFSPRWGWGSRVPAMKEELVLAAILQKHDNSKVVQWARQFEERLKNAIRLEIEGEKESSTPSGFE